MDEEFERERLRLLPFLEYYRFASGNLSSTTQLKNYAAELITNDDVWYEDAFHTSEDDLIDTNSDWCNVDVLDLSYAKLIHDVPRPLFEGSSHTTCDFARFLLSLKSHNLKVGDTIIAEIVGMFASFLPEGNVHNFYRCTFLFYMIFTNVPFIYYR